VYFVVSESAISSGTPKDFSTSGNVSVMIMLYGTVDPSVQIIMTHDRICPWKAPNVLEISSE
jgi:hypothetical protein